MPDEHGRRLGLRTAEERSSGTDLTCWLTRGAWIPLLGALVLLYWPLLRYDPVLRRDDKLLLEPLERISSAPAFAAYLFSYDNPDLQPVRDVSLMTDVLVKRRFGIGVFHLHNLLLWLACVFLAHRIARRCLALAEREAAAWAALFALHPLYVMSVSWIAARKHLLALLFLLLCLVVLEGIRRRRDLGPARLLYAFAAYLASVLSQPVTVLFPLWLAGFVWFDPASAALAKREPRRAWGWLALLLLAMVLLLLVNRQHYMAFYLRHETIAGSQNMAAKWDALRFGSVAPVGRAALALGRSFFQIVAPVKLAVLYSEASPENLAGLLLLPLFAIGCARLLGWRTTLLALGYFAVMLLLVLTKIRSLFLSDTYLLPASLGIWFLLAAAWVAGMRGRPESRWSLPLWGALLALFLSQSAALARTWISDERLWENAYAKEPNCFDSMNYALALYKRDEIDRAVSVADYHFLHHCMDEITRPLYYVTIYYHGGMADSERIALLSRESSQDLTRLAVLAAAYLRAGKTAQAESTIAALVHLEPEYWRKLHRIEVRPLAKELARHCAVEPAFRYCGLARATSPNVD